MILKMKKYALSSGYRQELGEHTADGVVVTAMD
jgi:hypothetical protein